MHTCHIAMLGIPGLHLSVHTLQERAALLHAAMVQLAKLAKNDRLAQPQCILKVRPQLQTVKSQLVSIQGTRVTCNSTCTYCIMLHLHEVTGSFRQRTQRMLQSRLHASSHRSHESGYMCSCIRSMLLPCMVIVVRILALES